MSEGLNVVGVQFRRAGKIYDFTSEQLGVKIGDHVVVETERGQAIASVVKLRYALFPEPQHKELKPILRLASERDLRVSSTLTPGHAEDVAKAKVREFKLEMRVLNAEIQFGGSKIIVYFSAPGRVDFRELVKALASALKSRVELKQVGARDETKIVGGLGICGREYCCSSFLREFVPVSIKMAKNQNLALNPTKVSGGCGRLLCCLTYENDLYSELRKLMPPRGTRVRTLHDDRIGTVLSGDLLNQTCEVEFEPGQTQKIAISQLEVIEKGSAAKEDETVAWGEGIDLGELLDE